jgi:hypothetical protein
MAYLWFEAGFRLAFTYSASFDADWVLWNGRVGDIAAIWLTISGVALVLGVGLYPAWLRRERVGAIVDWTIVLTASALAAPMIGEIGTAAGSPSPAAGSASTAAIVAYAILGAVTIATAIILTRLRTKR